MIFRHHSLLCGFLRGGEEIVKICCSSLWVNLWILFGWLIGCNTSDVCLMGCNGPLTCYYLVDQVRNLSQVMSIVLF